MQLRAIYRHCRRVGQLEARGLAVRRASTPSRLVAHAMASRAISMAGFLLIGNSVAALHRSWGDVAAVVFIVASNASLLVLFCCLRWFEAAAPDSAAKARARISVWLATTLLTAMFSWRVAALMPGLMAAAVWLMAACTVVGGFYALFILAPTGD